MIVSPIISWVSTILLVVQDFLTIHSMSFDGLIHTMIVFLPGYFTTKTYVFNANHGGTQRTG